MGTSEPAIITANDDAIIEIVNAAQQRLVALAPAFTMPVAEAVSKQWKHLGAEAVNVVLDTDPEVYRMGYGVPEALDLLNKTARELKTTLNQQPGIRIGVIVADNDTLIYTPTPLLIEAGRKAATTPNAIRLESTPPVIKRDLGQGAEGMAAQTIGLDPVESEKIQEVKADLVKNPPQTFDVARQVRVFNSYFEFVELGLEGTHLDKKKVRIAPYLLGVADPRTQEQLHASFNLVAQADEMSGRHLEEDRKKIAKQFLKVIPNYGTVVLRKDKEQFQQQITHLSDAVEKFRNALIKRVQTSIERNRLTLMQDLLPRLVDNPPKEWLASFQTNLDPETVKRFLDQELRDAFGEAEQLIKGMNVKCLFKGVTYEMLQDEKFQKAARKVIRDLPVFHDEYDAARAAHPDKGISKK